MEIRKKRKLMFRIDELSVTILFRITVELSYLRFRNPEIRIEFGIQRFHIPRFLDNKREEGELMRHSIDNDTYQRKEIADPNNNTQTILEPINKLSLQHQKQYYADINVMYYILQGIPNDIYNSVDACKDDKTMWNKIKRLMQGTNISRQKRHLRLMNEFDKFMAEDSESLTSVYERFCTLINIMDRNDITPKEISINTKLLNLLQPEWSKYVTLARQKNAGRTNRNQAANAGNGLMLLATKDKARVHLDEEENNFMLMNAYGDDMLEELNASMIMMACIQPIDEKSDVEPTYDAELINKVNASHINGLLSKSDHEHQHHEKLKTIIHTSADDQIDSDIIFDDPYV
ncbi:hypothetical protein Tco_1459806, partial [Tanacetum coccineum]